MSDKNDSSAISRANNRRFREKVSKQWLSFAADCEPLTKYLASRSYRSRWAPVKFLDALFRGYGQVVLSNNPLSGALIFIALIAANPVVSAAGLITASVGLLFSIMVLPQPSEEIGQGLTVFNPLLIGLITTGALPTRYGLELEPWHWFSMIIASIISVYVTSAFGNILGSLGRFPLPYLVVPFNIVQPILFLIIISVSNLNISDTSSMTAHNLTNMPPLPLPSFGIDNLSKLPNVTTQSTLGSNGNHQNVSKQTRAARTVTEDFTAHMDTVVEEEVPPHTMEFRGNIMKSSENFDNLHENITSVTTTIPKDKESVVYVNDESHLKPFSEKRSSTSSTEFIHVSDYHKMEGEPSAMHSSTTEMSPLYSASTGSEENTVLDEATVTSRVERSISLETTPQHLLTPHQNATSDVMEPGLDWGGVFSGIVLSMSQVFGISYAPTAILIYLAVLIYSPIMAAFGVLGATIGTLTGLLLTDGDNYAIAVYNGTWGFNGLLSAMCLGGLFFVINWPASLAAILCSFVSTVVQHVLIPPFSQADLVPMSLPFALCTLLFLSVASSGTLLRPTEISFPEKHFQEYRRHLRSQGTQEQSASTSDVNDKDTETEKKSLSEIV